MNPFGSRDEDPLLQNDPLAPSSDDAASDDEADASGEPPPETTDASPPSSEKTTAQSGKIGSGPGEASARDEDPPVSDPSPAADQSVFSPSDGFFAFEGQGDTRVVVRSVPEASEGRLTVLNAALGRGWRLARVELRGDEADRDSSPDRTAPEIAFFLRRPEAS